MVLEHGEIIERGDHNALMALKGRYYELSWPKAIVEKKKRLEHCVQATFGAFRFCKRAVPRVQLRLQETEFIQLFFHITA